MNLIKKLGIIAIGAILMAGCTPKSATTQSGTESLTTESSKTESVTADTNKDMKKMFIGINRPIHARLFFIKKRLILYRDVSHVLHDGIYYSFHFVLFIKEVRFLSSITCLIFSFSVFLLLYFPFSISSIMCCIIDNTLSSIL